MLPFLFLCFFLIPAVIFLISWGYFRDPGVALSTAMFFGLFLGLSLWKTKREEQGRRCRKW
ncbi:hypothetical protein EDD75_0272 [Thermodesulfitimonas autotrophica]|uniref:Uncharacterized protein n=1 Tax=Thermodesulfitimonas autotrophica TaxID=1894989 RepID=A0A3N5AWR8_9THEO|nr:hypothetical protein [Thermodesulfitimonas autotrophica]RPF49459.1 hypothetical protein EDD75_0272 [Thermodesulfitimonas autotrophica]